MEIPASNNYIVALKTGATWGSDISVTGTSHSFTGLANGTYQWRVRADHLCNDSWHDGSVFTVCGMPANFNVVDEPDGNDTTPELNWNASTHVTRYVVEVFSGGSCGGSAIQTSPDITTTNWTIATALNDGEYSFRVTAYNESGICNCSTVSDCDSFVICKKTSSFYSY